MEERERMSREKMYEEKKEKCREERERNAEERKKEHYDSSRVESIHKEECGMSSNDQMIWEMQIRSFEWRKECERRRERERVRGRRESVSSFFFLCFNH